MTGQEWAFNSDLRRTPKDRAWFSLFLFATVASIGTGIVAWKTKNPMFEATFHAGYMNDPSQCVPPNSSHGRRLHEMDPNDFNVDHLGHIALQGILASAVLAVLCGAALIHLFRKVPHTMVNIGLSLPLIFYASLIAVAPNPVMIGVCVLLCLLLVVVYFIAFKRIKVVGRMMQVAADALASNLSLIPFAACASLFHVLSVIVFGAALYFLQANGRLAPSPSVERPPFPGSPGVSVCRDIVDGTAKPCCMWQVDGWVRPSQVVVALVLMWSVSVVGQLRTYVLGGTITQWYFDEGVRGAVGRSLGHALGPARGTVCFSAAVITACNLLRHLANRIRNNRGGGILHIILNLVFSCLLKLIEEIIRYVSNLATIQAAGTGQAFLEAARSVGALLLRHRLSITVWWVPDMVLNFIVFGAGGIVGVSTFAVSYGLWKHSSRHHPFVDAVLLAIVVSIAFSSFMGWITMFLKSATEAVYVCFARDLENRSVTRAAVHSVLKELPPASGAVVVQPDNNLVYGAMEEGYSPVHDPPAMPSASAEHPRDLTAAIEAAAPEPKGRK